MKNINKIAALITLSLVGCQYPTGKHEKVERPEAPAEDCQKRFDEAVKCLMEIGEKGKRDDICAHHKKPNGCPLSPEEIESFIDHKCPEPACNVEAQ